MRFLQNVADCGFLIVSRKANGNSHGVMGDQGPPGSSRSVSVCFPAYNEEATIGDVFQEAHELLSKSELKYEILVCDDGSRDRTAKIIESMTARIPRLRAFHHPRNLGISATFEHLYSEAINEFVFLNSSDRQWATSIVFN